MKPIDTVEIEKAIENMKSELARLGFPHGHPATTRWETALADAYIKLGRMVQFNETVELVGEIEGWEYGVETNGDVGYWGMTFENAVAKAHEWNVKADEWRRKARGQASYPSAYLVRRRPGRKPGPWKQVRPQDVVAPAEPDHNPEKK